MTIQVAHRCHIAKQVIVLPNKHIREQMLLLTILILQIKLQASMLNLFGKNFRQLLLEQE
jgi:hypothetical protein